MIGWIFDIPVLKSILPQWVTMKFTTALSFFFCGLTVFLITLGIEGKRTLAQVFIPVTVGVTLIIMGMLLASTFFGFRSGLEDLFVKEKAGAIKSTMPGRPSVGTMISFILVDLAGILTLLNLDRKGAIPQKIGWGIIFFGGLALIGYMLNAPALYYT